jgi:2-O-methyltransferase
MTYMKKYQRKFNMFKVILNKNNPVIVEIGSHYGEDTLRFLETFENCEIHCFEPDPRNINIFKKYVNDPRVKLYEVALSDSEGTAEFFQSFQTNEGDTPDKYDWITPEEYNDERLNNSGSSSLKKGYQHTLSETISVTTSRFDTWCDKNQTGLVDLAWIDVQGAEREVILGMGQEIENIKFIWIEYGETLYDGGMTRKETVELLNSLGFSEINELSDKGHAGDLLFRRVL